MLRNDIVVGRPTVWRDERGVVAISVKSPATSSPRVTSRTAGGPPKSTVAARTRPERDVAKVQACLRPHRLNAGQKPSLDGAGRASGLSCRSMPFARFDSAQSRGGFSEQPHGWAGSTGPGSAKTTLAEGCQAYFLILMYAMPSKSLRCTRSPASILPTRDHETAPQ
jgi:hypothetical protein